MVVKLDKLASPAFRRRGVFRLETIETNAKLGWMGNQASTNLQTNQRKRIIKQLQHQTFKTSTFKLSKGNILKVRQASKSFINPSQVNP